MDAGVRLYAWMCACVIGRAHLPLDACVRDWKGSPPVGHAIGLVCLRTGLRAYLYACLRTHAAVSLCMHSSATTKGSLAPRARQPLSPSLAAAKLACAAVLAGSRVGFAAMRVPVRWGEMQAMKGER